MKVNPLNGPSAAALPQAGGTGTLAQIMIIAEKPGLDVDLNEPTDGHTGPQSQIISERASSRRSPR
jgi:hypothetical protein